MWKTTQDTCVRLSSGVNAYDKCLFPVDILYTNILYIGGKIAYAQDYYKVGFHHVYVWNNLAFVYIIVYNVVINSLLF